MACCSHYRRHIVKRVHGDYDIVSEFARMLNPYPLEMACHRVLESTESESCPTRL